MDQRTYRRPPPIPSALRGRYPGCGFDHLAQGFLILPSAGEACRLDGKHFDPADEPAFFVMLIVGLVVGLALWLEITVELPIWVHALVAVMVSNGLGLLLIRPLKGLLTVLQDSDWAKQGRFAP